MIRCHSMCRIPSSRKLATHITLQWVTCVSEIPHRLYWLGRVPIRPNPSSSSRHRATSRVDFPWIRFCSAWWRYVGQGCYAIFNLSREPDLGADILSWRPFLRLWCCAGEGQGWGQEFDVVRPQLHYENSCKCATTGSIQILVLSKEACYLGITLHSRRSCIL